MNNEYFEEKKLEAEDPARQRINKTERSQEWIKSTNCGNKNKKKSTFTVVVSAIDVLCPAAIANTVRFISIGSPQNFKF